MLHMAAQSDEVKAIKYLLEKGLDINKVNNVSDTMCMYC